MKLLQEDLAPQIYNAESLSIWRAGCGFAQVGLALAERGHRLTLCDVSAKMLIRAKQQVVRRATAPSLPDIYAEALEMSGTKSVPDHQLLAAFLRHLLPCSATFRFNDKIKVIG